MERLDILCTQYTPFSKAFFGALIEGTLRPGLSYRVYAECLSLEEQDQIGLQLRQMAYQQGFYLQAEHLGLSFAALADFAPAEHLPILMPESLDADEAEVDILLSGLLLERVEAGLDFDAELTETLLRAVSSSRLGTQSDVALLELMTQCLAELEPLDEAGLQVAWTQAPGALYKFLSDLPFGLLPLADLREQLNTAIKRQLEAPSTAGELALLLFKRKYLCKPERLSEASAWLAERFASHTARHGDSIEILEPVTNFKVSILIFTYNRLEWLKHCVGHILNQTYKDWQLIIADHASTDETPAYVLALQQEHDNVISWRYEENRYYEGIASILERFYTTIDTELVVSCPDDDWLLPRHLEETVGFIKAHPWVAAVGGVFQILNSDRVSLISQHGPFYSRSTIMDNQKELQRCASICPLGNEILARRELYVRLAEFDPMFGGRDGKCKVLAWDYMNNVKLFSLFEVGYVHRHISNMRAEPTTTSASRDNTYDFLVMLEEIIQSYHALYGPGSFPLAVADYWLYHRHYDTVMRFKDLLESQSPEHWLAQLEKNQIVWLKYVSTRTWAREVCSKTAPILFNMQNPYR